MEETFIFANGDGSRIYKAEGVKPVLFTRLNSKNPTDIFQPEDTFEEYLDLICRNGYKNITPLIGGKKSRKNRKHKNKSKMKKGTTRKKAY